MQYNKTRTWAEISIPNLMHNLGIMQSIAQNGAGIMAVLKANAYGHGALALARALQGGKLDWFALATLEEAMELREQGINANLLVLGAVLEPDYPRIAAEHGIALSVFDAEHAAWLSRLTDSPALKQPLNLHWKIDTGLARYGYSLKGERIAQAVGEAKEIASLPNIRLQGIWTHMACGGISEEDDFTLRQLSLFRRLCEGIKDAGLRPLLHCANSPTALRFPESHYDLIRSGNALYGFAPFAPQLEFKAVLSLKSRIIHLREIQPGDSLSYGRLFTARRPTRVAIIPFGFADGIRRDCTNRMHAIVHGKKVRSIGKFCMDLTYLDVSDVPGVKLGDVATIVGTDGQITLRAEDITDLYPGGGAELSSVLGARIPRIYV